ncbi:MAG: carbohydrate ABC transporter permease [Dorea sp.]
MRKYKKKSTDLILAGMSALAVLIFFPVVYMILSSFQTNPGAGVSAYYQVFLAEPGYLMKFWRSLIMCLIIAGGQTLISCLGGIAFAKYEFPGKRICFLLMALFMILPIQVTLLPNYILLEKMQLLGTWWALIIPGIFSPFGTVWLTFVFKALPGEWMEAASLDGAGLLTTVFRILVPAARPAVITLFIISFVDSWNMVEQPITFLKGSEQYPLSVFLAGLTGNSVPVQAVCGILCLIPVTFLFLYYQEELTEGLGDSFWS